MELAAAGVTLGASYPSPIIDHDFARDRVISAYKAAQELGTDPSPLRPLLQPWYVDGALATGGTVTMKSEHSPMSGFDEYPIHQIPEPLRILGTSDPRAYERYWFTAADLAQDVLLVIGFGFYPNLGTADAFAILVHEDTHTTVRAHRALEDDRTDIGTGRYAAR